MYRHGLFRMCTAQLYTVIHSCTLPDVLRGLLTPCPGACCPRGEAGTPAPPLCITVYNCV
eukprot:2563928-Pyramimonas_sp.AAC.1